jgi:L-lactate utilization protein LutC
VVTMETVEGMGIGMVTGTPADYGFATFIAGPSKTADIEQSLVLGAHGPRSMTVFLLDE